VVETCRRLEPGGLAAGVVVGVESRGSSLEQPPPAGAADGEFLSRFRVSLGSWGYIRLRWAPIWVNFSL
jgi:hypothetical protein